MVMCEVPLNRIEELLLGFASELRPALAVGDPPVPFRDRGHLALLSRLADSSCAPPRVSAGVTPVPRRQDAAAPVGDTFPERCRSAGPRQ